MSILSSFYQKMFGPAQPLDNFHETDRYKHYFSSNEFKLVNATPIPDTVLSELTNPETHKLKALIPRKVGLWQTKETAEAFAKPVTVPVGFLVNIVDGACAYVGGRPIAATGKAAFWLGNAAYKTCIAAGQVWNNYAPNEWAFNGSWVKPLVPNALLWSPTGDEALAKKIEMHEALANNVGVKKVYLSRLAAAERLYEAEVVDLKALSKEDVEGYNKHLRKVYGDERIGLLFRKAQAHLLRTSRQEVRNDYASQTGIKDKSKMKAFQDNFNLQLEHLPKAIESASAAIDELVKSFSSRESDFLIEIANLKEKLAKEEKDLPSLDSITERLLSIPEVTESLSLHQAVLALPKKANNPEQLYLAIQGLSKVMTCLRGQKSEDNAEKIEQIEADLANLEQFWPVFVDMKEALNAYEEIAKLAKDLRAARKDLLGNPEGFKDTFEKHPKTLLSLVRAFETLQEVESLPEGMKGFSEYFVSTLKDSIHIRAVAATELARILHYGLEVNPMDIPGLYTDMQSKVMGSSGSLSAQSSELFYGHELSGMPLGAVFKPHEFPDIAKNELEALINELSEISKQPLDGISQEAQRYTPGISRLTGSKKTYDNIKTALGVVLTGLQSLSQKGLSGRELANKIDEQISNIEKLKKEFSDSLESSNIRLVALNTIPLPNNTPLSIKLQGQLDSIEKKFDEALTAVKDLKTYLTKFYEAPSKKRVRIGGMLKTMKEKANKELADSPYKTPEEFLFRAALDFRLLELFLDQGSKEKDKRIKDLKKLFDSMSPAWAVDLDPEEAIEKPVQEELWKSLNSFLKEAVPGMKRGDILAAKMTEFKISVAGQLKHALQLLENICASEKGMNLIVACLDEKNPKRHHAFGNLFFRGVGVGQYHGDLAGKNENTLSRYRESLDFYAKAVDEALEYRVGFDKNPLVTGDDVNTFRHAAKKASYFLQSAEAMVRCENLLKNAGDFLNAEGLTKPDREVWTSFVEKLLRRLNAAITAEEKMTGVVIAEHWLFQDYAQGPPARNEDGTIIPQDGLDAKASAHLARILARKGVLGVLKAEEEELVKNIPSRGYPQNYQQASGSTYTSMLDPRGGSGGIDPRRDYAQENRSAHVEYLRPAVRMAGHAKNPSNLLDLYRWKSLLLDAIRRPEDADTARRNALQRKEEGIIDKKDFFFDEKKFQELYKQFGGIEEKEEFAF